MRTTLTLDPDVAIKAKKAVAKLHKSFKETINTALRIGLEEIVRPPRAKRYRTKPRRLGSRSGLRRAKSILSRNRKMAWVARGLAVDVERRSEFSLSGNQLAAIALNVAAG